ncbi:hypothetical protein KZY68_13595, partial [Prevotella salivae]
MFSAIKEKGRCGHSSAARPAPAPRARACRGPAGVPAPRTRPGLRASAVPPGAARRARCGTDPRLALTPGSRRRPAER